MINNMNGMYMPNYQYAMQGYQTMQNPKLPNMNNVLNQQQQKELQQNSYSLQLTPQQIYKATCTHKKDGNFATIPDGSSNPNGVKCTVCNSEFNIIEDNINQTSIYVKYVIDMINTIQTVGIELPQQFLLEIGKMKAVLGMIPEIHNIVMKTWDEKYSKSSYSTNNAGSNSLSLYNYMVNGGAALSNPNIMQQNLMQQGMMGTMSPYYQQQQMYQQPMMQQQINPYNNMGWQQPTVQPNPYNNMNMNYPNINNNGMGGTIATNNNSFFQDNQQPAYSQSPTINNIQPNMQEPSKPAQSFQPPTGANKENKLEDKAIATKPIQP